MLTSFQDGYMNYSKSIFPPGTLFIDIPSRGYCPQRLNPFEKAETNRDNIRKVSTIKSEEITDEILKRKDEEIDKAKK